MCCYMWFWKKKSKNISEPLVLDSSSDDITHIINNLKSTY